jgi:hypothetical protein
VIGQGPWALGQEALLTLRVPPVPSMGNLLVIDDEGQPLPQRTLAAQQVVLMAGREVDPVHLRFATNATGRARFHQERLVQATDSGATSATIMTIATEVEEGCLRWGVQSWAALMAAGEVELGELVVGREWIHSGVVYDEQDQPLAFAQFNLKIPAPWPNGEEHQIWTSFKADEAGRFRVLGEGLEPGTALEVYVSPPSTDQQRSKNENKALLIVGQLDQSLRLNKAPRVEGRVLIPADVPHERLQLNLELTDGTGKLSNHFIDFNRENGRFSQGKLPLGMGRLVLRGSGGLDLAHSEYFSTEGTGVITPAGWQALDLRGRVFVHKIEIKGADGSYPERASVKLVDLAKEVTDTNPVTLITVEDPLRITVESEGYRSSQPTLISGLTEITLAVGIPVAFVLPQGIKLPEGSWEVRVLNRAQQVTHELTLAPDGRSWVTGLPHPGAYKLALGQSFEQGASPGQGPGFRPVIHPDGKWITEFEIADTSAPQTVLIEVTQTAINLCTR